MRDPTRRRQDSFYVPNAMDHIDTPATTVHTSDGSGGFNIDDALTGARRL
jgi:hypothetical protein